MQGQRIGKVAVGSGNISLDGVGHGVHTGVGHQLLGHGVGQLGVDDGDIGGDLKVSDRILDALLIIGNDGEGSHLGSSAGGGGDGAEVCLAAQRRDAKDLAHILKGDVRILVLDPHGLGGVDGGTAADGNDPVRLEFLHCSRALHDGLNGRVRLDTLEQLHFHAGFFQVSLGTDPGSRTASWSRRRRRSLRACRAGSSVPPERFGAVIQVTGESKSCHKIASFIA